MASFLGSLIPATISTCTDIVVYQPVLAALVVYNVANGAYAVYSVGHAFVSICGSVLKAGYYGTEYAYNKLNRKMNDS